MLVGAAVGIDDDTLDRVSELINNNVDTIIIDTAHGHSKSVINMTQNIKKSFPNIDLIVGNVATSNGVEALIDAGADAVKIGIGSGSSCTTRMIAGVGVPQLSSILNFFCNSLILSLISAASSNSRFSAASLIFSPRTSHTSKASS